MSNTKEYELPCGCKCEYIGGRYITLLCDEHDAEMDEEPNTKQTKMKDWW